VPVVPTLIVWDGLISILRTYRREELESFIPEDLREELEIDHGTYQSIPGVRSYFLSFARRHGRHAKRVLGAQTETPGPVETGPSIGQTGSLQPREPVSLKPRQR
jgi:hypothetical protein